MLTPSLVVVYRISGETMLGVCREAQAYDHRTGNPLVSKAGSSALSGQDQAVNLGPGSSCTPRRIRCSRINPALGVTALVERLIANFESGGTPGRIRTLARRIRRPGVNPVTPMHTTHNSLGRPVPDPRRGYASLLTFAR